MENIKVSLISRYTDIPMKAQLAVLIGASIASIVLGCVIYYGDAGFEGTFFSFYQKNLRGYLFSGFISVGSFLLSLHTFVIVNLRDKLFATSTYRENYARANNIAPEDIVDSKIYKPLDNLSCFINISIWLAIITAISQFTVGLANFTPSSIFCIWLAMLTICFMLNSLILIRENIKLMLR